MNDNITWAQIALTGMLTAFGALWGKLGWMFVLWAVCAGLDYLTGCLAALRSGTWDSEVAHAGIWHKAAMVVVVLAGMLFDLALHEIVSTAGVTLPSSGVLVTPLLLSWYIVAELGSIVENAIKMGAQHVPKWLRKGLKIVSDAVDAAGEKTVGNGEKEDGDGQHP